ncbi:phage major tail tube protein [Mesorhizobium sp. M6A.T.Cr.TU.017.01.1.1]|uniref:phage major tail tube protein n=3 Tax=Mesorhizobium TaxID=68287 RepID=UPI000F7500C4|nr:MULTISPECIES: phage major tail tube protein [unclassified Mesorhizobium]AZO67703.1 phage major tail tube protein [Mesorhizobium sp. M6A.T.Cr.TU.016.01.1.1]RUV00072.1 phage major tail tube protein [Mesorhizobium sp. M6A.T.Cr.TU.017.01.1.1]
MTAALPRQLKAFNLYLDGGSFAGRCDSITLPTITLLTEEHRAGGMDAPKKLEMGMEAMTATIILSDYDPAIISLIGVDNIPLTARGAVQAQGKNAEAAVVNMRGLLAVTEFSEWKPGTKSTKTLTYELDYFRYRQADVEYVEIDIINMVRRIGGVDQLATQRNAIGL